MNKPELSIICAGFRSHLWARMYNSIDTCRNFELIIVSPYDDIPQELKKYKNIRHFKDYGNPMRAAQIAAILAEGEILKILMADDGIFLPQAIDKALLEFDNIVINNIKYKKVLVCKYLEGLANTKKIVQPKEYYQLNYHQATRLSCIPNSWYGLNDGFIYRKYFEELGGWDCRYETPPMGCADLAIRIQRDGGYIQMSDIILCDFDWYPQDTGDHKAIFDAQTSIDEPLYQQIYQNRIDNLPIKIDLMNWKNSDNIWRRRFN